MALKFNSNEVIRNDLNNKIKIAEEEARQNRETEERRRREREERERREAEERARRQNEENKRNYRNALDRLSTANTNQEGAKTADEYGKLAEEFVCIATLFKSLPSSFDVKAQIEACDNSRKVCLKQEARYKHEENTVRFNKAKAKIQNAKTADEYGKLAEEFAGIAKVFKSLPSYFDVKTQIEACDSSQKDCLDQAKKKRRSATNKRKLITVLVVVAIIAVVVLKVHQYNLKVHQYNQSFQTYTFSPRPVGTKNGKEAGGWLVKVMRRDGYETRLYLSSSPTGKGSESKLSFGPPSTLKIQDLDDPSKTYSAEYPPKWDSKTGAYIVTFPYITSNRFIYFETEPNPPWIIEEIILGDPDSGSAAAKSVVQTQPRQYSKNFQTYTFSPRPVGTQNGKEAGGWLVRVMRRDGYETRLYLSSSPTGKGSESKLVFGPPSTLEIQDLDDPSKTYSARYAPVWDDETGTYVVTFPYFASNRFTYIETQPNPPWIIEEIILGDPDSGIFSDN
jgi:hypothetical protein